MVVMTTGAIHRTTIGETRWSTGRGLERKADITRITPLQVEDILRIEITVVVPMEDIRTREEVLLGTEMATEGGITARVERRLALGVAQPSTGHGSVHWIIAHQSAQRVVIYITHKKTVTGAIQHQEQQGVNQDLKPQLHIDCTNQQVGGHQALQGAREGRNIGT